MASRKSKPPVSQWIVDERKRLGWKVDELSRRLVEAGYDAQPSTISVWEAGRKPSEDNIAGLERLFGSSAPREQADTGDLAAAIRLQAAAIERQTEVLAAVLAILRAPAQSPALHRLVTETFEGGQADEAGSTEPEPDPPAVEREAALPRTRSR